MHELDVAVPTPLAQTFTYTAEIAVSAGTRVLVPFGKRRLVGVVLGAAGATDPGQKLKAIEHVIDEAPVYSPVVLEIAKWISTYYFHPIGEVLRTMLPASATKVVDETYVLTEKGKAARAEGHALKKVFARKDELTAATLKAKLRKLPEAPPLKEMLKAGLLSKTRSTSMRARAEEGFAPAEKGEAAEIVMPTLTATQAEVTATLIREGLDFDGTPKPFLLHGVTGAGKTEVYLRTIAATLERSPEAQTLVLVPEISLTPQMTRVFERRFPGRVAVVHSALSDPDRWAALSRIRKGEASILIGPRSAVFGPFRQLCLILVDEEHDGSYKQTTGLPYNGRDVAVLRGKLEGATVVLGSATPSMESYQNALTGRYSLLELPERATGRPLPTVSIVEADKTAKFGSLVSRRGPAGPAMQGEPEIPIDPRVVLALRDNLARKQQSIVLVNRRGYAFYLFSLEKKKAVQCPQCSISLTLHARSAVLRCHYCDYATTTEKLTRERPDETFIAVGYGSQKAEDAVTRMVPGARVVRIDSDSVNERDFLPKTLNAFRDGEIDILVGTQILAKGHDFPNVTLIVILEVDQLLDLPDFRAGERTFQLLVQASGRAGRAELAGEVLVQTIRAGHPVVATALRQDFKAFAAAELQFRQQHCYPPFARMIAIELNGEEKPRLDELCRRIEGWIEQMAALRPDLVQKVRILGPAVPPIEMVRRRHRRSLIFCATDTAALRQLAQHFLTAFQKLPADVRLKIDVDPQSLI